MPAKEGGDPSIAERQIIIKRVFDAPARLLFAAYSRPEHVRRWFGPVGWPITLCEIDFREGGSFRFAMTGPSGQQNTPFGGQYLEIIPDRKITYDNGFELPGAERMIVSVTFDEKDGRTTLTIDTVFGSLAMAKEHLGGGYEQGVGSGLDQLAGVVAELGNTADREIVITRVLNAPRALVWKAWNDPRHLDQWMGPRGFITKTSSMDARKGGEWRFVMRHEQYGAFQNRYVYREIVPPERLVFTHDSGVDDDPSAFEVTVTFVEQGQKTLLTMHSVFPTVAAFEKVKGSGATEGGNQTLDRLAEHLAQM